MANKDKKPTLKDLADAAQKQGFKLEFETHSILNDYLNKGALKKVRSGVNFPVNRPPTDMGHLQTNTIVREIDVYGSCCSSTHQVAIHFLIECKGTSPENKLLLVEETNSAYYQPNNIFTEILIPDLSIDGGLLTSGGKSILSSKNNGPLQVFTGDFFKWDENKCIYTQAAKNEDANNLYKGVHQLNVAIAAMIANRQLRISQYQNILVPMIVTNAEISVVNYEENEIFTVPWAFYRNRIEGSANNIGYIPYIIITSLNHLSDCLATSYYEYNNWKKNPVKLN